MKIRRLLAAAVTAIPVLTVAVTAGPAQAAPDQRCKVPPLLFQVAAVVDPDSLEGCDFFEDPNYHENRKEAGIYTDKGVFSLLFG